MIVHLANAFEEEIEMLDTRIAEMGGLAEQAIAQAVDALEHRDPGLANATLENGRAIDWLERAVEELAISLIARAHPTSQDLRRIVTALRIAIDLKRIGDLAGNIAKGAIAIANEPHPKQAVHGFVHIGEIALRQLKDALDAYSQRDAGKALKAWEQEQQVDAMYNSLYRELLAATMDEPRNAGLYAQLLFGAKNLERVGDHATNIAETTYFLISGTAIAGERPVPIGTNFTLFAPSEKNRV